MLEASAVTLSRVIDEFVCCVEGVGDVVMSNDATQVSARHADVPDDV